MAYVEIPETGFTVECLLGKKAVSEVQGVSVFYRAWRNLRLEPAKTLIFFERHPLDYGFGVFSACLNVRSKTFGKPECWLFKVPMLGSLWPAWRSAEHFAYERAEKLRLAPTMAIPRTIEDLFV